MNLLRKTFKYLSDRLMTKRLARLFEEGSYIFHAYRYPCCRFTSGQIEDLAE